MIVNSITWDFDPEIFSIGNHEVRWYGLMFALGFLAGYQIFKRYLRAGKLTLEMVDSLLLYTAIGGVVGARLGHCLFYEPGYFLKHPLQILMVWKGGLASHGGIVGLLLALWLYTRKFKIPFLWLMDRIAIGVAPANAFIRIGNFFNSEIYGLPTKLPWGVEFVRDRLYDGTTGEILPTVARHPTQIYEALSYLLIFLVSFLFYRKKYLDIRDGYIFSLSMIAQFVARFLIEFLKNDQVAFEAGMNFNMGQLLSLPFIFAGIVLLVWTKAKPRYFTKEPVA
ncbi:MAG: prolipoprotein diacylglyceryl transferase [Bacteroidales bacterium]